MPRAATAAAAVIGMGMAAATGAALLLVLLLAFNAGFKAQGLTPCAPPQIYGYSMGAQHAFQVSNMRPRTGWSNHFQ